MYKSEIRELKRIIREETRRTLKESIDRSLQEKIQSSCMALIKSLDNFEEESKKGFDSIYSTLAPLINPLREKLDEFNEKAKQYATKIDNSGEKVIIGGDKEEK